MSKTQKDKSRDDWIRM